MQGQGKSRRWRDGDYRGHKALTQSYRVTARFRMRRGSDGAGIAGFFASAVTERVSGCLGLGVEAVRYAALAIEAGSDYLEEAAVTGFVVTVQCKCHQVSQLDQS